MQGFRGGIKVKGLSIPSAFSFLPWLVLRLSNTLSRRLRSLALIIRMILPSPEPGLPPLPPLPPRVGLVVGAELNVGLRERRLAARWVTPSIRKASPVWP